MPDREWFERKAREEGDMEISVGPTVNLTPEQVIEYEELALEALPQWAQDEIRASRELARRSPSPAPVAGVRALEWPQQRLAVPDDAIKAALYALVPGGSKVWVWLPQNTAYEPAEVAFDVMRSALAAAAPLLPSSGPEGVDAKALVDQFETVVRDWTATQRQPFGACANPLDEQLEQARTRLIATLAPSSSPTATMEPT